MSLRDHRMPVHSLCSRRGGKHSFVPVSTGYGEHEEKVCEYCGTPFYGNEIPEKSRALTVVGEIQRDPNKSCSICLGPLLQAGKEVVTLKVANLSDFCPHVFHKECITRWFKVTRNCPECRQSVQGLVPVPLQMAQPAPLGGDVNDSAHPPAPAEEVVAPSPAASPSSEGGVVPIEVVDLTLSDSDSE